MRLRITNRRFQLSHSGRFGLSGAAFLAALGSGASLARGAEAPPPAATTAPPPGPTAPETAPAPDATGQADAAAPLETAEVPAEPTAAEGTAAEATAAEATPAPEAEMGADVAASDAALEEDIDLSQFESSISEEMGAPQLDVYGFADFTYLHWVQNAGAGVKPSFMVGNFNVYLSTEISSNWRSLAEVRFLYLPHGVQPAGDFAAPLTNTTVADPIDFQRPLRWGGVEIERVWLEYTADPLLNIRGGQWLTPYGVWNVDHGSPVIIATHRPFIIGETLLPERQTGLEIHGTGYLGSVKLGYHLTLSNGRGPSDAFADLDGNKAVGGRLFAQHQSFLGDVTLGVSGYRGRYTSSQPSLGAAGFTSTVVEQYDELGYAADLRWLFKGFHLQSEVVVQEVAYGDYRPTDAFTGAGDMPDYRRWGGYALLGYRTPFLGIMPYVNAEFYDSGPAGFWGKVPAYWVGINMRPDPSVVLKAQYLYADAKGTPAFGDIEPFGIFAAQAAWAF